MKADDVSSVTCLYYCQVLFTTLGGAYDWCGALSSSRDCCSGRSAHSRSGGRQMLQHTVPSLV